MYADYVRASWAAKEPALAGRFDFAYDGNGPPKALEYNADTPTALLEASVVQWQWLQEAIRPQQPEADQFNSLHEKLIANWRALGLTVSANTPVHFSCMKDGSEDRGTIEYQRDVATQAGLDTRFVFVEDIGWADDARCFVDTDNVRIAMLYKLYPWEWLIRDEFAPRLLMARPRIVEPAWKMLLSSKALMAILWELNPGHPNLLPASFDRRRISPVTTCESPSIRAKVPTSRFIGAAMCCKRRARTAERDGSTRPIRRSRASATAMRSSARG